MEPARITLMLKSHRSKGTGESEGVTGEISGLGVLVWSCGGIYGPEISPDHWQKHPQLQSSGVSASDHAL
ncbi:MAG: hypothetical protein GX456_14155 [Verrucomicrobia bacterium]|nr:hypothetical protein [Verrucomicrobiota bacterium]